MRDVLDVKQQDEKSTTWRRARACVCLCVLAGGWGFNVCWAIFYFLPHANVSDPLSPAGATLGGAASISHLINFIFTHLFLNALSDGRAVEVLARPQSEAVGAMRRAGGRGVVGGAVLEVQSRWIFFPFIIH